MALKKHVDLSSYLSIISVPLRQQKYQPFGDILLSFPDHETIISFRRELDISRAICRTSYKAETRKGQVLKFDGNLNKI